MNGCEKVWLLPVEAHTGCFGAAVGARLRLKLDPIIGNGAASLVSERTDVSEHVRAAAGRLDEAESLVVLPCLQRSFLRQCCDDSRLYVKTIRSADLR